MINFFFMLVIWFSGLKLFGLIDWSWVLILFPIYTLCLFWFTVGFFEGIWDAFVNPPKKDH